jgi:rhodanese-related sulfurtransferase
MVPESNWKTPGTIVIFLFIFIIIHCGGSREPFDISVDEARILMGNDNSPTVIDVRTPEEYVDELGHIAGSRLIPINVFTDSIEALSYLKDSTVIVVCKVGFRSKRAVLQLLSNDFSEAYNLYGGMEAWNEAGEEIER